MITSCYTINIGGYKERMKRCESMKIVGLLVSIAIIVSIYMLAYSGVVPLSNRQTEPMELSDTLSLYKNKTGCFEAQLPGLVKDQLVQVYLSITSGTADLNLVNSNNELCENFSENGALKTFTIDREDDYRLLIDVKDADFVISVYVIEV